MTAGIPASALSDEDLERELAHVHEKRHDIFLHGNFDQLLNHTARTEELELAYLERFGDRVADADRKREAVLARAGQRAEAGRVHRD
jgi:hypothetical protein